ncbi:MAG: hypothetical protein JW791_00080 [Nanoarchaeota archaeon]|nr:hypothetical protein [Nanoarchaeota archaeon]
MIKLVLNIVFCVISFYVIQQFLPTDLSITQLLQQPLDEGGLQLLSLEPEVLMQDLELLIGAIVALSPTLGAIKMFSNIIK